jgi:hypothetical protein
MKVRWLCVALLIGLTVALTPMAFASPPDPSWIAGFWDDDDFDDVILFLTGSCPAIAAPATRDVAPVGAVVTFVADRGTEPVLALVAPRHHSRAPPAS